MKENTKMRDNRRRELAMKRDKRKKIIRMTLGIAVAIAIVALIVINATQKIEERVFTDGNQTITLRDNGTFSARLAHDARKRGNYEENVAGDVTTVVFTEGEVTTNGTIVNNVLTIPAEWEDAHGHGRELWLVSGGQQDAVDDGSAQEPGDQEPGEHGFSVTFNGETLETDGVNGQEQGDQDAQEPGELDGQESDGLDGQKPDELNVNEPIDDGNHDDHDHD